MQAGDTFEGAKVDVYVDGNSVNVAVRGRAPPNGTRKSCDVVRK